MQRLYLSQLHMAITYYTIPKSKMILRRQEEDDEAYYAYAEEADDAANKNSALI